jgi:hypothetical protein
MDSIFTLNFLQLIIMGFCLGWFVSNFEPLQSFLNRLKRKYFGLIIKALGCHKCSSFWGTLILGFIFQFSIPLILTAANIASIFAFLFDNYLSNIKF